MDVGEKGNKPPDLAAAKRPHRLGRLSIGALLVVGGAMVATAAIEAIARYQEIEADGIARLDQAARNAGTKVAAFLDAIEIAMQASVQSAAAASGAGLSGEFRLRLLDLLRTAPAVSAASIVGADGLEVAKVSRIDVVAESDLVDQSTSVSFQRARSGNIYYGRPSFVRESEPRFTMAMPIEWLDGALEGVLIAELDLRPLSTALVDEQIGDSGYSYVVSREGELIAHRDLSYVLQHRDLSGLEQVRRAHAGDAPPSGPVSTDFGSPAYVAYVTVPGPDWRVLAERPASEVRAAALSSIALILALLVGCLAVLAGVAAFLNARLLRPLRILRESAHRINAGDFKHRAEPAGVDELEDVVVALNRITARWDELDRSLGAEFDRRARAMADIVAAVAGFRQATEIPRWDDERGSQPIDQAISLLEGVLSSSATSDQRLVTALSAALCRCYVLAARSPDARHAFERATAAARSVHDTRLRLAPQNSIMTARALPELLDLRLSAGKALHTEIASKRLADDGGEITEAYFLDLIEAGDFAGAGDVADTVDLGARRERMTSLLKVSLGISTDVENAVDDALEEGLREGLANARLVHAVQTMAIRREQGRLGEWLTQIERYVPSDDNLAWRPLLAVAYLESGAADRARPWFERVASDGFDQIARNQSWPMALAHLAEVSAGLNDAPRASALYELLLPFAGHNLVAQGFCLGAADRYLGQLAGVRDDWETALGHFDRATKLNAETTQPLWHLRTLVDRATALLALGREEGASDATLLLNEALAISASKGLIDVRDRCLSLLSRKPHEEPLVDGLSPREIRVLRLLATGATNKNIGEKLFVSQHTVANHVRNILGKTKSANRMEAANYARRHSLVADE